MHRNSHADLTTNLQRLSALDLLQNQGLPISFDDQLHGLTRFITQLSQAFARSNDEAFLANPGAG